ncbi:response regulator [Candidatus Laterigemmans baculatus]|uniref:response regulator n=1 Tax=Candidatus Laterigemmans baculatus TaxID=2770505 RepID=UPI0013DB0AF6|nr:response regulator [Candidatus Laterigemmans baculatus]
MKPARTDRSDSISPWISPSLRSSPGAGSSVGLAVPGQVACVLLVDDREPFRYAVAAELQRQGVEVLTATGAYDAWRLARHRHVDLIVIRGDLRSQSGWQCAAKLCGRPPWRGVILHFDRLSHADRNWEFAAGLSELVESRGRSERVVEGVLRELNGSPPGSVAPAARPLSVAARS